MTKSDKPSNVLSASECANKYKWYAIVAGGQRRTAWVGGVWIIPLFKDHDECTTWWRVYCTKNKEHPVWGVTEKQ